MKLTLQTFATSDNERIAYAFALWDNQKREYYGTDYAGVVFFTRRDRAEQLAEGTGYDVWLVNRLVEHLSVAPYVAGLYLTRAESSRKYGAPYASSAEHEEWIRKARASALRARAGLK